MEMIWLSVFVDDNLSLELKDILRVYSAPKCRGSMEVVLEWEAFNETNMCRRLNVEISTI